MPEAGTTEKSWVVEDRKPLSSWLYFSFFNYVYVRGQLLQESIGSPGSGVRDSCKLPVTVLENQLRCSPKAARVLNSPVLALVLASWCEVCRAESPDRHGTEKSRSGTVSCLKFRR